MAMSKVSCHFDSATFQYQSFSIPEKIVYYIAKNVTNAETFQKLVQTCKYFFKINPVIVVPYLSCNYNKWYACYDADGERRCELHGLNNVKIWVQQEFVTCYSYVSQIIPWIYKNDATVIIIRAYDQILTFGDFLFIAGKADKVSMTNQIIKYENGDIVPFEVIIQNLPKLTYLKYESSHDGRSFTINTTEKLMEIEHFKNITFLKLCRIPETFNVETMLNYILENKHIQVYLWYSLLISNRCKELIQKYSNFLEIEDGCISKIDGFRLDYVDVGEFFDNSSSEDSSSETSFVSFENDDNVFGNDYFPWNNEDDDEWELPWDKFD